VAAAGDGLFEAVDIAYSLVPCDRSVLLKRNVAVVTELGLWMTWVIAAFVPDEMR